MAKFGFTDNDGTDVGEKYVTKEYAIDVYPNIFSILSAPALWSWGGNPTGELGDGSTTNRSSPGTVADGGTNWRSVHCTFDTTSALSAVGLKSDGTLWTWGRGAYGALGSNATANRSSPATTSGGGTDWAGVSTPGGGGRNYQAAIKSGGTIWTWGRNNVGQLGTNNTTNRSSPATTSGGGTDWKMLACGYEHMVAIKTGGTLWTWGRNNLGQLGSGGTANRSSPATVSGGGTNWVYCSAAASAASAGNSAGIKSDGTLWTWGENALYGMLGDGSTNNRSSPGTTAGGGTNWKNVSCGGLHMVAVKTDGTLWTWGLNSNGQLGNGGTVSRSSPGTVAGAGANWVRAVASRASSGGIKGDGTLWTWGQNTVGQLGNGSTTARSSPGTVVGPNYGWKSVVCGYGFSMGIYEEDNW